MCHSPLRTIHPAPNRRYQEVEMGEKYVWLLYRVIKSITIKCPNMHLFSFSKNSIPKPKTCRITLNTGNLMLSKRYESTEVDRRTWLNVPSVTLLSTSSDIDQVVEIQKETSTKMGTPFSFRLNS